VQKYLNHNMAKGDIIVSKARKMLLSDNPDFDLATDLLNKALKVGNPEAAYALGTWYFYGRKFKKDIKKGIKLWQYAAKQNFPDAVWDLAISYEKGVGLKRDLKKAFECYQKAALYGEKNAFHAVGRCYYYGIGTQQNRTLAWIWLDKAKSLGVTEEELVTG